MNIMWCSFDIKKERIGPYLNGTFYFPEVLEPITEFSYVFDNFTPLIFKKFLESLTEL
jgi:hypothetical protein